MKERLEDAEGREVKKVRWRREENIVYQKDVKQ